MTTPAVKLLVSVNGAGTTSGLVAAAFTDTLQFSIESSTGIAAFRYEIAEYPAGFATPSGWTLDSDSGAIYSTSATPSLVTLPASPLWGKWVMRLRGYDQYNRVIGTDETTIVEIVSPGLGLHDFPAFETSQAGGFRGWTAHQKANLRLLNTAMLAALAVATAGATTLVIRPSIAASAGNVFKTFAEAYAVAPAFNAVEYQTDEGFTIASGAYAIARGTRLVATAEGITVFIADGGVITTGGLVLERVELRSDSAGAAIIPDASNSLFLYLTDSTLRCTDGGMINGTGAQTVIALRHSRMRYDSLNPLVSLGTTGALACVLHDGGVIDNDVIAGSGGASFYTETCGLRTSIGSQVGFSGTRTIVTHPYEANGVTYPATGSYHAVQPSTSATPGDNGDDMYLSGANGAAGDGSNAGGNGGRSGALGGSGGNASSAHEGGEGGEGVAKGGQGGEGTATQAAGPGGDGGTIAGDGGDDNGGGGAVGGNGYVRAGHGSGGEDDGEARLLDADANPMVRANGDGVGFNGADPIAPPVFTVSNADDVFGFDVATDDLAATRKVVGAMLRKLIANGIFTDVP